MRVEGPGFSVQGVRVRGTTLATSAADVTVPCITVKFRVQGLGVRVQGLAFRVQGSGFRVQGLGFRV